MGIIEKIESEASKTISRAIVKLLERCSDDTIVNMTRLAERLTNDPEILAGIRKVRQLFQDPTASTNVFFKKVLNYLPYESKVKIFNTLFYNAWFLGNQKRTKAEQEYGFRPPFIMILSPTFKCNLRCKGCYTLGYGLEPELPFELVERILRECEELGIYFVTILGGEPLVYKPLFRLIEMHPNMFFQVYTNGTLVTKEVAKRFRELGNVAVVISIEGYEEETDAWRGRGVYKKIMNAFDLLREERIIIGSSATVTSKNVEVVSSEEFIEFMIEKGSLAQMYFLYVPVNGRADFSLMVRPEQRDLLRRRVLYFRRTKPIFILDFWNDGPYVEGCIAGGRMYFHINAKGDVEPCVYTHIAVDNIKNKSLREVLDSPLFRAVRRRQPHNCNHLRPCMIIDNPHVMREIIAEVKPYFTHPGAEEIYTTRSKEMDQYAERFGRFADKIWEEEYVNKKSSEAKACSSG